MEAEQSQPVVENSSPAVSFTPPTVHAYWGSTDQVAQGGVPIINLSRVNNGQSNVNGVVQMQADFDRISHASATQNQQSTTHPQPFANNSTTDRLTGSGAYSNAQNAHGETGSSRQLPSYRGAGHADWHNHYYLNYSMPMGQGSRMVSGTLSQPRPVLHLPPLHRGVPLASSVSSDPRAADIPGGGSVRTDTQHDFNLGAPPHFLSSTPHSNRYSSTQQAANPATHVSQTRRHSRTQSTASQSPAANSTGTNGGAFVQPIVQGNQQPERLVDGGRPPSTRRVPPMQLHTAHWASVQMPETYPGQPYYYPVLPPTQRAAQFPQDAQIQQILRRVQAGELRALQAYQEFVRRRGNHAGNSRSDEPTARGLDVDERPPPKETEELTVLLECKVCMSQLVDTVMLPCGHAVMCRWCADQCVPSTQADGTRPQSGAICPMCRSRIRQKIRIYFP